MGGTSEIRPQRVRRNLAEPGVPGRSRATEAHETMDGPRSAADVLDEAQVVARRFEQGRREAIHETLSTLEGLSAESTP